MGVMVYRVGGLEAVVKLRDFDRGLKYDRKGNIEETDYKVSAICEIRPRGRGDDMDKYGRVVIFHKGKRIAKRVHRDNLAEAAARVKKLREQGFRAHLVFRTDSGTFPPPRTIEPMRDLGKWWCPYCRAWRFFSVPRYKASNQPISDGYGPISDRFYMNSCAMQQIRLCQWCLISENDFYVRKANGTWGEINTTRRRRRKKKT